MQEQSLRLWPGVIIFAVMWLLRVGTAMVPDVSIADVPVVIIGILGMVVGAAAIVLWWLFFSRVPWSERLAATALMILGLVVVSRLVDPSIAGGMMGMMLPFLGTPVLVSALVVAGIIARGRSIRFRRGAIAMCILVACVLLTLVRTDGVTGDGQAQLHWRWTPTAEERLLAAGPPSAAAPAPAASSAAPRGESASAGTGGGGLAHAAPPAPPAPAPPSPSGTPMTTVPPPVAAIGDVEEETAAEHVDWPGFRGPNRDAVIAGVRINPDWSSTPPVEMWRQAVGPGWSSFAVDGDLVYTQEQRGNDELVSCYRLSTGEPVWRHADQVRFYESNGGPGPRATPTLNKGRVYTHGAKGMVNALDARTGALLWSRNAAADTGVTIPDWGVTSSPLVVNDLVIVAVSGRLIAYDVATGQQRWLGPAGGSAYSSPHLASMNGVKQILLARGSRTISVSPKDGTLLWQHSSDQPGVSIVQPARIPNGDLLIAAGDAMGGLGIRRIAVTHGTKGWNVEDRWVSRGLKPYFNDFVVHKGHAYGFDGSILASIDLTDGSRKWKGGRYGSGQLMLLPDQDLLLVLSEEGELALVSATPDKFTEVARVPAITGKTWNHPALIGSVLLVRNGEEMAAFRLPEASR